MKHHDISKMGFTLIELGIVVLILAILSSLVVRRFSGIMHSSRVAVAEVDMATIRTAFLGSDTVPGYIDDMSSVPGFSPGYLRIANLLMATNVYVYDGHSIDYLPKKGGFASKEAFIGWSVLSSRGWRGPYIGMNSARSQSILFPHPSDAAATGEASFSKRGFFPKLHALSLPDDYCNGNVYGYPGEPAILDPWGNPYVLQIPPAQAFSDNFGVLKDVSDDERFRYARIVSAGPDGFLSTPCFYPNTNSLGSCWTKDERIRSRTAGTPFDRGDDLVLFLNRADLPEED